jgi:hypothetical protein
VLQSPEGGSGSVGKRKFRVKRSVTPPLTPVSLAPPEGIPLAMPANMLTERIPPRVRSSRFSTLAAATDKIMISKNVLIGLCLTTFAFGIVTTLAVDHIHARASEAAAAREPEPVVLQTMPIEPAATPSAAAAAAPAPSPSSLPSSPPPAPPPPSPAVQPQAAAAEVVVVQLPSIADKAEDKSADKSAERSAAHAHLPPSAPSHGVRQVAAAAVRAPPPATHKRTSAPARTDSSPNATEAAPDEDLVLPAPTKKKWVDPFDQ